jgi:ATP-dependent DNA helicase RecG
MREIMAAAGIRESIFETDGFFQTILYRPARTVPEIRQTTDLGSATQKTTQKTAQKILKLIAQNPRITREDLADQIGISTDGVKYHLNRMREQKLIRRIGPDRGGHWEIIDD